MLKKTTKKFKINKQELKNCRTCGKIFVSVCGEKLCRSCKNKEEELENQCLEYVRDHQGISINEVMKELNLSDKFIKNMIRKRFFSNSLYGKATYHCQYCGELIKTGVYCYDCLKLLRDEAKKMANRRAVQMGIQNLSQMSTIQKINAQAENELLNEKNHKHKRRIYESVLNNY